MNYELGVSLPVYDALWTNLCSCFRSYKLKCCCTELCQCRLCWGVTEWSRSSPALLSDSDYQVCARPTKEHCKHANHELFHKVGFQIQHWHSIINKSPIKWKCTSRARFPRRCWSVGWRSLDFLHYMLKLVTLGHFPDCESIQHCTFNPPEVCYLLVKQAEQLELCEGKQNRTCGTWSLSSRMWLSEAIKPWSVSANPILNFYYCRREKKVP